MGICAWCDKEIPDDCEVFGFGARVKEGIDFEDQEGQVIHMFCMALNRNIPAIVVTRDSQAKRDGLDIMFMACSVHCAEKLKGALEEDRDEFDKITYLH